MSKNHNPKETDLLIEWKKRLGLQDWAIILQINCSPKEMEIPDSEGCTTWEESTKSAQIQIADPGKIGELVRPFDFEEILVHELLHIKTTLLSKNDPDDITDRILHQTIDDLGRALVDAKRAKPGD